MLPKWNSHNFQEKAISTLNQQGNIDLRLFMNNLYSKQPHLKQIFSEVLV